MPRDLDHDHDHQEVQGAPIANGDEAGQAGFRHDNPDDTTGRFVIINGGDDGDAQQNDEPQARTLRSLHPYTRPLTISDLDSCVALENVTFAEHERCSPEKVSHFLYVTCPYYSSPLLLLVIRKGSATYHRSPIVGF